MKIDSPQFASALAWLEQPSDDAIPEMAGILYQLNHNRMLYSNILRCPQRMRGHLVYQLRKALAPYLQCPAASPVPSAAPLAKAEQSDLRLTIAVKEVVSGEHKGARADHDNLPDPIKELYDGSKERWFRMKELHNTLQQMDGCSNAERAPYTRQLRTLYGDYRKCLNQYDHYDASAPAAVPKMANPVQQVSAARKYLSDNRKKLAGFISDGNQDSATLLRTKMQNRVDVIIANGGGFDHDYQKDLEHLGLVFSDPNAEK